MHHIIIALENEFPNHSDYFRVHFSGVGKVNAALKTAQIIERDHARGFSPTIINYGTAGIVSGKEDLIGSLIKPHVIVQRDMNSEPLTPRGITPYDKNGGHIVLDANEQIVLGTGDSFVTKPDPWFNTVGIDLVDMEAYAIAKVCQHYRVPFVCYKWVSDFADEDAAENWQQNVSNGAEEFKKVVERNLRD